MDKKNITFKGELLRLMNIRGLTNFPFIEYDFDALTNYELLSKVVEHLNKVITNENNVTDTMKQLIEGFNGLYNYVNNYFDNLDVQEEINKKLDDMLLDGTLEEIIGRYITSSLSYDNIKLFFPRSMGFVNSGDSELIKAYDKNILIDSNRLSSWEGLKSFLTRNNSTHIDYFILTHYHDDHAGNIENLINNGFIDEQTFVYLPAYSPLIENNGGGSLTFYNSIRDLLETNSINNKVPTEGEELLLNDFKLTFYNCETSIFNLYNYTDYNDCSTVCLLEYGNMKALYTGDISNKPFTRFNDLNMFNYNIDIYKIEHHGINYQYPSCTQFLKKITPRLAIQLAELNDVINNVISQGSSTAFLKYNNCRILSTYENENDIIIELNKYDYSIKQGKENLSQSNRPQQITLYVNSNTNNSLQLGTQQFPFKDLPECLGKLVINPCLRYVINLSDGEYATGDTTANAGKIAGNTEIIINGNSEDKSKVVIKNGIQIFNGINLTLRNVTLNTNATLLSNGGFLILNNVELNGNETENKVKTLIYSNNSNIVLTNSLLKDADVGISGHYDRLYINNSTFENLRTGIQNQYGSVQLLNNTYNNVTNNTNLLNNTRNLSNDTLYRKLLYSGNVTQGETITLNDYISKYRMLLFQFGAVSTGQLTTAMCLPFSTQNWVVGSTYQVPYVITISEVPTASVLKFKVISTTQIEVSTLSHEELRCVYGVNITNPNE